MSEHEVKVVRIEKIIEHENADSLVVIPVWGFTCCSRIGEFKVGDLAAYIEPDTLVPVDQPEFDFLKPKAKESYGNCARIRATKLRGVVSMGLLVPAREGWAEGDNVMEELGCKHYDPPIRGMNTGGENTSSPSGVYAVKYDMENFRKYPDIFVEGEPVVVTEKIHGANSRFVFSDGEFNVSSHTQWKQRYSENLWWQVAEDYRLEEKLKEIPFSVVYGEVYGRVQDLRYGSSKDDRARFAIFDILDGRAGKWLSWDLVVELCTELELPLVPVLARGPWDPKMIELAEGPSQVKGADHVREGCVIKPTTERYDKRIGRVILKVVGNGYLTRKDKK